MAQQRAQLRPNTSGKKVLKIRLRVTNKTAPAGTETDVTDLMLQAGATVTGWGPHVTELPWTSGIVGGSTP